MEVRFSQIQSQNVDDGYWLKVCNKNTTARHTRVAMHSAMQALAFCILHKSTHMSHSSLTGLYRII